MVDFTPIGYIETPWPNRFGIPRQPSLAKNIRSKIVLSESNQFSQAIRGLEAFSHIWVIFHFHETKGKSWKPIVRPPRLGGKTGKGVFATRSPFRPNPIGLSAVKILEISEKEGKPVIEIMGGDFLHGTPVLDIKPYVVYADSIPEAVSSWAQDDDQRLKIQWITSPPENNELTQEIEETIALDPRPGWERGKDGATDQSWGVRVRNANIRWQVMDGTANIIEIQNI